ncbi:PINc domain-containing protein [Trichostrongylus colubriformis]|uniref:PINc domain-containing protein n=1 Tax=Trichostrongylus colubriformis TaxID=6319 RepID=A0AAN8IWV1_TRICO
MLATGSLGSVFSNDVRELRSTLANSTDGRVQAQDLFVYRPPLHPSQIRGCVMFDTCSIVNYPDVMGLSVANPILIVVPFVILKELDQLNKFNTNASLRARSRDAMRRLRRVNASRYVYLEDSPSSKTRVSRFVASNNDERILSCAYRIQSELPPDCPHKIIFVTDDCNLQLKADAHAMKCLSSEDYCKLMNESRIPGDPEEPMEIDSDPDPVPTAPNTSDMPAPQKENPQPLYPALSSLMDYGPDTWRPYGQWATEGPLRNTTWRGGPDGLHSSFLHSRSGFELHRSSYHHHP